MIDAHVHLDKGRLSLVWVNQFVDKALEMDIETLYLLQHTNVFSEFMPIYQNVKKYNKLQQDWVVGKEQIAAPLSDYIRFIKDMKKRSFPIKILYGLEVCYAPEYEAYLSRILPDDFDFLTGSIHTIDGWAFSLIQQKWSKDDVDINKTYSRYYELMIMLAKSNLFTGLAHPDSLACFGVEPILDLTDMYIQLANSLLASGMYIEQSSGLAVNYNLNRYGMSQNMYTIMKSKGVPILTASDAHKPNDVGMYIKKMDEMS